MTDKEKTDLILRHCCIGYSEECQIRKLVDEVERRVWLEAAAGMPEEGNEA